MFDPLEFRKAGDTPGNHSQSTGDILCLKLW
jgi:hypothetical protein